MARPENDQASIRSLSLVGAKSFAVSLPIEIIRQLGWHKSQKLIVRRMGEKVVIEKKTDE